MNDFWTKVESCDHEDVADYGNRLSCTCGHSFEWHCKKCGVYITDDPCGERSGMSGWPAHRWSKRARKAVLLSVRKLA